MEELWEMAARHFKQVLENERRRRFFSSFSFHVDVTFRTCVKIFPFRIGVYVASGKCQPRQQSIASYATEKSKT